MVIYIYTIFENWPGMVGKNAFSKSFCTGL
jgi:hypothetical protein